MGENQLNFSEAEGWTATLGNLLNLGLFVLAAYVPRQDFGQIELIA